MPRLSRAVCVLFFCVPAFLTSEAAAATLTASIAGDPVEESPVAITLSGTSETARKLFAVVVTDARPCEATAAVQDASSFGSRITPIGGIPVGPGDFTQAATFTPQDDATYRLCVHLADSTVAIPVAAANPTVTVRAPSFAITTSVDPAQYEPGQTVRGRVLAAATAVANRELRYGWSPSGDACATATPATVAALASTPLTGSPQDLSISVVPAPQAAVERLCAYVVEKTNQQREGVSEALATAVPRDVLMERWRPIPISAEAEQEDRLRLSWKSRGTDDAQERLEIWDEDPADGADPVISDRLDSEDEFELMDSANGEFDVRVRRFLGFREFWWSAGTDAPGGETSWSTVQSVSVVPSPLVKKRVRVNTKFTTGYSTKRPGTIRLRITSSPRARVQVKVTYRGRTYWKKKYTEGVGRLRGFDFKQTCSQQGQFTYEVRMRDPYGTQVTKRGHWSTSVSRCASLRAKEQRKAAEEERKRREREEKKQKGSGGSGGSGDSGSNCDSNYTGYCLDPNASDYDCQGGSGNGPKYVPVTVTVVGDDHYGLDADGDGLGCE